MRERIVHIPRNPVAFLLPRKILPSGHFLMRELRLRLQRNRALFLVRANQPNNQYDQRRDKRAAVITHLKRNICTFSTGKISVD